MKPTRRRSRLKVGLEIAELDSRVGDLDEGIAVLRDLLSSKNVHVHGSRPRILLRLATLYCRRGDFQRADAHFRVGLEGARRRKALSRREHLYFLNEHAAVKAFRGDNENARRLVQAGLAMAGKSRSLRDREVALNLHATRANIALRTFDLEAAAADLEQALQAAEALGSPANQAIVLNNLGIVYGQCDRYEEARRSLREAERTCLRLEEGPSLVSIYGNLAVLEAKRGDFAAADGALSEAERLGPSVILRRQQLFLGHARGLTMLLRGRFAAAGPALEAAARLGVSMGDNHLAAFDGVYRGEALIHEINAWSAPRAVSGLTICSRS